MSAGDDEVARESGDDVAATQPWWHMGRRCYSLEDWVYGWLLKPKSTAAHARWSCSLYHRMKQEGWGNDGDDEKQKKASGCRCAS